MPARFRALLGALGVFITSSGALAVWTTSHLHGWPLVRGLAGAAIAIAIGARLTWMAARDVWPAWLAAAMGDEDATSHH